MDLFKLDARWISGQLAETLYERYLKKKREPQYMVPIRVFPYQVRFRLKIAKENWTSAVMSSTRLPFKVQHMDRPEVTCGPTNT